MSKLDIVDLITKNPITKLTDTHNNKFLEKVKKNFSDNERGSVALPARVAFGTLIIKEHLGLSDRETVAQITENPYLQFFLGFQLFVHQPNEP